MASLDREIADSSDAAKNDIGDQSEQPFDMTVDEALFEDATSVGESAAPAREEASVQPGATRPVARL